MSNNENLKKISMLLVFLFLFILTQWSSSVYLPIVPKISLLFPSYQKAIIASLSWFFLGYAIGQLFWGILSDYICRYFTLIIALTTYCLFELLITLTHQAFAFVFLLSLAGFSIAANTSVGNALVKDIYQQNAKAMIGYIGIAMACAPVIAPIIGSHLYLLWGWKSIFIFLLSIGLVLLINFSLLFKDKVHIINHKKQIIDKSSASIFVMLKDTFLDRLFINYALTLSVTFGLFFSILLITPFWLVNFGHFSANEVGYLMFFATVTYIIGAITNVVLTKYKTTLWIVHLGLGFLLFGLIIFLVNRFFSSQIISLVNLCTLVICMLGIGMVLPASKAGAMLARNRYIGTAASVMKFVQTLGPVVLTRITAYCISHHNNKLFIIMLMISIALLTLFSIMLTLAAKTRNIHIRTLNT